MAARGGFQVQAHGAAGQPVGVEVTERQVAVGDRGGGAAAAVTNRTRRGAGAFRPDLGCSGTVEAADRTAARTDLGEIDRRQFQHVAGTDQQSRSGHDAAAHFDRFGAQHLAVLDQPGLGGRSAMSNVTIRGSSNRRARAAPPTTPAAGPDSMIWAGDSAAKAGRGQPAVGLHQLQRCSDPQGAQPGVQRGQVGPHHGLHIRVDDGGAGAGIFLDLRQDLAADGDGDLRQCGLHGACDRLLVCRVGITVQQADGDAGNVLAPQHSDRGRQAGRIEGNRHRPVGRSFSVTSRRRRRSTSARGLVQPISYSNGMRRSRISRMSRKPRVVIRGGLGALGLQDGVRSHRGGVQDVADDAGLAGEQCAQSVDDALAVIMRRGGDLVGRYGTSWCDGDQSVNVPPISIPMRRLMPRAPTPGSATVFVPPADERARSRWQWHR